MSAITSAPFMDVPPESQRDPPSLVGGPVAGILHLDGLMGEGEAGARRTACRDALHEILDLLEIAARPFLLEADELPAGLPIDLLGDVDVLELRLVGQVADE